MDKVDDKDIECLRACNHSHGGWRPWRGVWRRAERLANRGLLLKAGIAAMPPHVLYVISEKGEQALFGPR